MKYKIIGLIACFSIVTVSLLNLPVLLTNESTRYHQHIEAGRKENCNHVDNIFCTHLPLVEINTNGVQIPGKALKENAMTVGYTTAADGTDRIYAQMEVTNNEKTNNHTNDIPTVASRIEIHVRGNSSRSFDKSSYSTFLFLSVVVGSATLYKNHRQKRLKNNLPNSYYIPITIIVPAYNEEVTVVETVRSLLTLEYKLYEIIVVDDGSMDMTSQSLIEAYNMKRVRRPIRQRIKCQMEEYIYETLDEKVPLTLIRKKNGGKADTLNMGINASNYPYFICMDADSILQYDSLQKISQPILENDKIVAVGSMIRPSNDVQLENGRVKKYKLPKNLLACMQVLEYDRSFLASRILLDKFNGSLIISGAFGLFKKDVVIDAGGYNNKTMGEDMELVVRLHEYCTVNNIKYSIKYATDAICWTQAPERLRDLCIQRKRWHIGLFQTMYRHRRMFANTKFGAVSLISYLYFLIYELLSPFIEIFGILTVVLAFAVDLINIPFMIILFLTYTIFGCILSLTSFYSSIYTANLRISFKDALMAIGLCMFEITCLRFVLAWVRITAFIGYRNKKLVWGRIERKKITIKLQEE